MPISNYVIASHRLRYKYSNDNGFLIVHARVPIPRKGSNRLIAFREKMQYDVFLFTTTFGNTPAAPFPDHPPRRVSTRNEICLMANEILLRKVKSVCDG